MATTNNAKKLISSGESHVVSPDRVADVELKHKAVADVLQKDGFDALLIQRPENFSWLTSGGDSSRAGSSQTAANLFITPDARILVSSNVDSLQLFERELPKLGFQLKERPWQEPRHLLVGDLCRGRKVASDTGVGKTQDISETLRNLRVPLTVLECERLRMLGKQVAHAAEATARHCFRGQTEAEVAGQVAHRLIKHQILPERIQVFADRQGERYRHWSYGETRLDRTCTISVVGRKWGLCVAATRTVSFGEPPKEFLEAYHRAVLLQATGIFFSQPKWKLYEVWNRVVRIYEKLGIPDEWRLSDQGEIIGYEPNEMAVVPNSEFQLTPRMALYWHPSVGPAMLGDTALVTEHGAEVITALDQWPRVKTEIKGHALERPEILFRDWHDEEEVQSVGEAEPFSGDSVLIKEIKPLGTGSSPSPITQESVFDQDHPHNEGGHSESIFD